MIVGVAHITRTWDGSDIAQPTLFVERDLPNHETKKPLLRHYAPLHDIAVLDKPGVPIELVNHRGPIFQGEDSGYRRNGREIERHVNNLAESAEFFAGLFGCKPISEGKLLVLFDIPGPPSQGLRLSLIQNDRLIEPMMLDDFGQPCLAFLATQCDEQFQITVNGITWGVEFKKGPSGEIVLLLQKPR